MVVTFLGAAMTVGACGLIGLAVARSYSQRPQQLRMLQSALLMLETEITYAATPLPRALEHVGDRIPAPVSDLFLEAAAGLSSGRPSLPAEAWRVALAGLGSLAVLRGPELSILREFGQGLGLSSREEQLKNLQLTREQLRQEEVAASLEREKNERMWRALGFLVGLTVVLLMY